MKAHRKSKQDLVREVEELLDRCAALERDARAAAEAGRAKGEFLADISREMRAPLNAVIGLAERFPALKDPAEMCECVRQIKHSSNVLLAIVDNIQDLSRIEVESTPGRGSAFTFSLPVVGVLKPALHAHAPELPAQGLRDISPLSLLLAEDNRINQFFLKDYFEALGHAVDIAENGRIVLDMLEAKPYDLILMDIQMPHMDGLEATRIIRASKGEPWSSIPIVALTAYALSQDRDKALAAGMDAYVPKPINFEELEREIVNALAMRGRDVREGEDGPPRQAASSQNGVIRRMFRAEVPQRQEALCAYLEAEDMEGLSGEAHGLRNGAHFAGATAVYELATELENAARQGRKDDALTAARRLLETLGEYMQASN